jgi:hypothetical protein
MKHLFGKAPAGIASLALMAIGLSPAAKAQLSFSYEDTVSGHAIGSAFSGPFRVNLQLFDSGSLYPSLGAPGASAGYGQNGTGTQSVAGGISTLNGISTAGPTGGVANEDSWGIARVISITDLTGSVVWSEAGKNAELTLMFYGEQDFYIRQLANDFQEIDGRGLNVDWYYQSKTDPAYTQYNPLAGSAGRTSASTYATVTDGTKVLTTTSTAGFIHGPGELGGTATEFASIYNQNSGGTGQTYLSVTGGTMGGQFDTNGYASPFLAGVTADMFAQFTTVVNDTNTDWLVRGNDPVSGTLNAVPEPSTYGLMAAGALVGLVALRRRKQKQA